MYLLDLGPDFFIPFLIFAIPIVAIVGGITAGIIKTLGQQRLIELAQRERIAALERGIDPSKLPPMPMPGGHDDLAGMYLPVQEYQRRRAQGLLIGGIVTLAVGIGVGLFLRIEDGGNAWAVGFIPGAVGLALLLSAWIIWPKDRGMGSGAPPRAS